MVDNEVTGVYSGKFTRARAARLFAGILLNQITQETGRPTGFAPRRDGRSACSGSLAPRSASTARVVRAAAGPLLLAKLDRFATNANRIDEWSHPPRFDSASGGALLRVRAHASAWRESVNCHPGMRVHNLKRPVHAPPANQCTEDVDCCRRCFDRTRSDRHRAGVLVRPARSPRCSSPVDQERVGRTPHGTEGLLPRTPLVGDCPGCGSL
jgi:hypothetical protein